VAAANNCCLDRKQSGVVSFSEDKHSVVGRHLDRFTQNQTRHLTEALKIGDIA
jgi:hypothetical protein